MATPFEMPEKQSNPTNFDPFSSTTPRKNEFNVDWTSAFDSNTTNNLANTSNVFGADPFANFSSNETNKSNFYELIWNFEFKFLFRNNKR